LPNDEKSEIRPQLGQEISGNGIPRIICDVKGIIKIKQENKNDNKKPHVKVSVFCGDQVNAV
jgi:hypothetical protein